MDHRQMLEILNAGGRVYDSRLNLLVWKKTNGSMGSFYRSQHELIFLFKRGTGPHINHVQPGVNRRYRTNVLGYAGANTFRAGRDKALAAHPTPKPVPLIADLIRDASNINDWVLDCFARRRYDFYRSREDPPACSRNRTRPAVRRPRDRAPAEVYGQAGDPRRDGTNLRRSGRRAIAGADSRPAVAEVVS